MTMLSTPNMRRIRSESLFRPLAAVALVAALIAPGAAAPATDPGGDGDWQATDA